MFTLVIVLAVILLDVLSKYLTVQLLLPLHSEVTLIPHLISFSYVENTGAAFGILKDHRWIFMSLSVVLIAFLVVLIKKAGIEHKLFTVSVSMILGGGIGNMIDRIFVGYVVDFIKFTFIDFPVFNIADSAVVIGTALLMVYFVFFDKTLKTNKTDKNI